jgi:N-acetylglucosamine-6-phosphate deacetylase
MLFKNGTILDNNFKFVIGDVRIQGDKIVEIGKNLATKDHEITDINGKLLIPGLIDIHIHGAGGVDYSTADYEGIKNMANFLGSIGVTSFLATSMALPAEELEKTYALTAKYIELEEKDSEEGSAISKLLGIHMEGPYFSFEKRGAQDENYLSNPDYKEFLEILKASQASIKIVSIAPELPGGLEFIKSVGKIKGEKPVVAIGHTVANYQQAKDAIDVGVSHVTHLYNGMLPFMHRAPGVLGAVSEAKEVTAELISDGVHVHPSAVRLAFKLFGQERLVLISDGLSPMGCAEDFEPEGGYWCGHRRIFLRDGAAKLEEGTLAGSNTSLMDCVKNAVEYGISKEEAIKSASINPAKLLGLEKEIGSIAVGKSADFIILDQEWNVERVYINGKRAKPFEGC